MKIYRNISGIKAIKFPVVTIGGFDGVHSGHMVILKRLVKVACDSKGESVVITFSPHPRLVLYNDSDFRLLTTDEEKIDILESVTPDFSRGMQKSRGIDHLIIYPFTKEFSELSSDSFIENIIVNKLHTKKLIIGYDHHFGNKRLGNISKLINYSKSFDFEIEEIKQKQKLIEGLQSRLSNEAFISKAPEDVVLKEKERLDTFNKEVLELKNDLANLL